MLLPSTFLILLTSFIFSSSAAASYDAASRHKRSGALVGEDSLQRRQQAATQPTAVPITLTAVGKTEDKFNNLPIIALQRMFLIGQGLKPYIPCPADPKQCPQGNQTVLNIQSDGRATMVCPRPLLNPSHPTSAPPTSPM